MLSSFRGRSLSTLVKSAPKAVEGTREGSMGIFLSATSSSSEAAVLASFEALSLRATSEPSKSSSNHVLSPRWPARAGPAAGLSTSPKMHGAEVLKQGALADSGFFVFGGTTSKSLNGSSIRDVCESASAAAEALVSGVGTEGTGGAERDPEDVEAMSSGCAQTRSSYFLRQISMRSSFEALAAGRAPAESPPNWAFTTALPLSCMRLISSGPQRYVPLQPLTLEMCVPKPRCTSEHATQRKTPILTLAHVVPVSPHSAQREFAGCLRSCCKILWCSPSSLSMRARGNLLPSLLVHMSAFV